MSQKLQNYFDFSEEDKKELAKNWRQNVFGQVT